MDNIIRIEHLTFEYGDGQDARALDDISLDIERGSFTAIIGRNGSGKSTLAKCVNALLLPTMGDVFVGGMNTKDEEHVWEIRQTAGMVFQNPDNQIVASIVEDDVAFGPENLGIEQEEIIRRVRESLDAVRMGAYRKKAPHMLSGGQKQRIAIAGAVAMRPECIVFDEPTAMLDPKGRAEVVRIIKELNAGGITCVLITHYMEEASGADRIIVMDAGRVAMDGAPKDIFRERDELRRLGLDVPMAAELAARLREDGFDMPLGIVTEEELVNAICG